MVNFCPSETSTKEKSRNWSDLICYKN